MAEDSIANEFLQQLTTIAQENQNLRQQVSSKTAMYGTEQQLNTMQWQLDHSDILEKIEHILRGDVLKFVDGEIKWLDNPTPHLAPFNENGVQTVMQILTTYINKNIILGDYNHDQINGKALRFAMAFNDLLLYSHNELGMNTPEKKRSYEMIVRQVTDIVHGAYVRAKDGKERMMQKTSINLNESVSNIGMRNIPTAKKTSMLNPLGWFRS